MSELAMSYQWITTLLTNDAPLIAAATGGVWRELAPPNTVDPICIFQWQSGVDVLSATAFRIMTRSLLQVKAVGPAATYATLVTIADRIDALMKRTGGIQVTGGVILSSDREQPFAYSELVNGVHINHLGGLYRIQIQGS